MRELLLKWACDQETSDAWKNIRTRRSYDGFCFYKKDSVTPSAVNDLVVCCLLRTGGDVWVYVGTRDENEGLVTCA